jgi:hypothetical protein
MTEQRTCYRGARSAAWRRSVSWRLIMSILADLTR